MILRAEGDGLMTLYLITVLLFLAAIVLKIATGIMRGKRRTLPRCEDCAFCRLIPSAAGSFYNELERDCKNRRGHDEAFGEMLSIVTVDDFCNEFRPKKKGESRYG